MGCVIDPSRKNAQVQPAHKEESILQPSFTVFLKESRVKTSISLCTDRLQQDSGSRDGALIPVSASSAAPRAITQQGFETRSAQTPVPGKLLLPASLLRARSDRDRPE